MAKIILVCGARDWKNKTLVHQRLSQLDPDTLIIEGECRGADIIARNVANEIGLDVDPHPADWEKFKKGAGPIRNREMLNLKPELVIAFHNDINNSSGTKDCVKEACRRKIPVEIIGEHKIWKIKNDGK